MNVLRIRLSLQEKREVLVAAGQLALIAADGAAQSAIVKKSRHEKYLFLIYFFKSRHEKHFCGSCFFKSGHGQ